MALPTLTMPATVPDWRAEPHDFTLVPAFAEVPVVVGAPRRRRVATAGVRYLQVDLTASAAQAQALHAFIEDDLQAGVLPFAARVLADDGTRQWWHARLADMPQWEAVPTRSAPLWQVSARLRLEGEPSATAPGA